MRAVLIGVVLLLAACGLLAIFSAAAPLYMDRALPPHFIRHLLFLGIGACATALAAQLPLRFWRALAPLLWLLSVALLAATLFVGSSAGGAQRWLRIPLPGFEFGLQPVEFVKFCTVLAVAFVLSRGHGKGGRDKEPVSTRLFMLTLGIAALPAGLCLLQPDLGSAVILFALAFSLLFVAGARLRFLLLPGAVGAVGVAAYIGLRPYALRRLLGFLDPWERSTTEGFQLVQSFIAFGRGGLGGVGLGNGRQKLYYLPEAHNDFILSVIAEETGLLGVLFVLIAFGVLLITGLRVALQSRERFGLLLGAGATLLLTLPALLNVAVVMGCLPTKGLTLPFLSYGGSSLLACCLSVGLLLSVARAQKAPRRRRFQR